MHLEHGDDAALTAVNAPRFSEDDLCNLNVARLVTALDWLAKRYEATLAGKPVRDADECLLHAVNLVADYDRDVQASRSGGAA